MTNLRLAVVLGACALPSFAQELPPIKSGFRPLTLAERIASDQRQLWRAPFHLNKQDAKWWLLFGGAAGALIVADRHLATQLPNSPDQIAVSNKVSYAGASYTLFPAAGALFLTGWASHRPKLQETGLLALEAMADAQIITGVVKLATGRERPLDERGRGEFGEYAHGSFPSGHAIGAWAFASVVAHQYPDKKWVPVLAYTMAAAVSASRFSARRHFASDVLVGSALGYFIGRHVTGKRSSFLTRISPQVNPVTKSYGVGVTLGR